MVRSANSGVLPHRQLRQPRRAMVVNANLQKPNAYHPTRGGGDAGKPVLQGIGRVYKAPFEAKVLMDVAEDMESRSFLRDKLEKSLAANRERDIVRRGFIKNAIRGNVCDEDRLSVDKRLDYLQQFRLSFRMSLIICSLIISPRIKGLFGCLRASCWSMIRSNRSPASMPMSWLVSISVNRS